MSDYKPVKDALAAGTPPELVCAACPWDRLCITPPTMTAGDIDRQIKEAEAKDAARPGPEGKMPVGMLMTALVFAGKDTAAQLCPVFALKLRGPEGREVADTLRSSMRGEPA
jgi:hypothetical protein